MVGRGPSSDAPRRRWFELASDLRIHLFAVVYALGTIHHEIEFVSEQLSVGPLGEYLERWRRAIPTVDWPSEVGVGLHVANVAISLLIMALPWRRELLCLLAVTFLLSQVASPARIASHGGLMAGVLLVILLLGVAEWVERAAQPRGRPAGSRTDWYGWTLTGLAWLCALTYLFAFFYKLNPDWFSRGSSAPQFLIEPIAPIMEALGAPPAYRSILAPIAIYGTLLIELSLPALLFWRPTRLFGCFVGLVFHLPMIAYGIGNFPTLVVACYPAFMGLGEARELLDRCTARPTVAHLVWTVLLGGFGIWGLQRSDHLSSPGGSAGLAPWIRGANTGLTCATFVAFVYVTLMLGAWLVERRSRAALRTGDADGDGRSPGAHSPGPRLARRSTGSALAATTVLMVGGAFVYLNLARFFGYPAAGAMIMYSGIGADRDDHLVMPRVSATDAFSFVTIVRFDPRGIETREATEFSTFLGVLAEEERRYQLNLNYLRYHMARICDSAPGGTVRLRLRTDWRDRLDFENVCAEPSMLWYLPLPVASECEPSCGREVRRWARSEQATDEDGRPSRGDGQ